MIIIMDTIKFIGKTNFIYLHLKSLLNKMGIIVTYLKQKQNKNN